jgi:hypothetical protein
VSFQNVGIGAVPAQNVIMSESDSPIICTVTKWYFKRMAMLGGMLLFFAIWFYKDGKWTWPAENANAEKYEWFQKEVLGGYDLAKKEGRLEAWIAEKKAAGFPLKENGEPEKWLAYSSKLGIPEKPKRRTEKEIEAQFHWASGMALAALLVGVNVLLNRSKKLIGYEDHLISPEGKRMNYADAYKIDKRPWPVKGLAYVFHRPGGASGQGSGSKIALDDLKYDGTHKVLDLLMTKFRGELIEKLPDEEEGEQETAQEPPV